MFLTLFIIEKSLLVIGILLLLSALAQYIRRTADWRGVLTMFFKRIDLSVGEYRFYRLAISAIVLAAVLKVVLLTFYP